MNSLYVDKFYVAQGDLEDICFGEDLEEGMTVLLESATMRVDMDRPLEPHEQARADEVNRWCQVTRIRITTGPYGPLVEFVGVYPDGTKRVRRYAANFAWIVKRMPEEGSTP